MPRTTSPGGSCSSLPVGRRVFAIGLLVVAGSFLVLALNLMLQPTVDIFCGPDGCSDAEWSAFYASKQDQDREWLRGLLLLVPATACAGGALLLWRRGWFHSSADAPAETGSGTS